MSPERVVYFIDWSRLNGGAQYSSMLLVEAMARRGVCIEVVVPHGGVADRLERCAGVSIIRRGRRDWGLRPWPALLTFLTLCGVLRRRRGVIVHVTSPVPALFFRMLRRLYASSRLIYHYRAVGGASARAEKLLRWVMRGSHAVIVPTHAGADDARRLMERPEPPIFVIPNPVEGLAAEKLPLPKWSAPFKICMVARNEPVKGVDVALEAIEQLHRQRPDLGVRLTLVCDLSDSVNPSYARSTKALLSGVAALVDHVEPPIDVNEVLKGCHVVWMPSRFEAFGRVAAESLAIGRPVIASRTGGLPAVVGHPSALIEPANAEALVSATIAVLECADLAEELVAQRVSLQALAPEVVAEQVHLAYMRTLQRRRG